MNSSSACRTCASVAVVCRGWRQQKEAHQAVRNHSLYQPPASDATCVCGTKWPAPAHLQVHLGQRLGDTDDSLQLAHSHRDGWDVAAVRAGRSLALLVRNEGAVRGRSQSSGTAGRAAREPDSLPALAQRPSAIALHNPGPQFEPLPPTTARSSTYALDRSTVDLQAVTEDMQRPNTPALAHLCPQLHILIGQQLRRRVGNAGAALLPAELDVALEERLLLHRVEQGCLRCTEIQVAGRVHMPAR